MRRNVLLGLALTLLAAGPARGQAVFDFRGRNTPGLVLETGARLGTCHALAFTADGQKLLAAGEDKVVRVWKVTPQGLEPDGPAVLRWSTWREVRGSIYAMALSPDERRVAVAGYGVYNGAAAVIDRATGQVLHGLGAAQVTDATRAALGNVHLALAFAPSGRAVALGSDSGHLWLWSLDRPRDAVQLVGRHPELAVGNPLRFLRFLSDTRLLSAARDGAVMEWDLERPAAGGRTVFRFAEVSNPLVVTASRDGRWLAAAGEFLQAGDRIKTVEVRSLDGRQVKRIPVPAGQAYPQSLALDDRGDQAAVGLRFLPENYTFVKEVPGRVEVFDLRTANPLKTAALNVGLYVERLAFAPGGQQLALADCLNGEVRLWGLAPQPREAAVAQGPGSSLWGVGLSADGKRLAYQDQRAENPASPNQRGLGPWRVFDLERRAWVASPGNSFRPVPPLETAAGWTVAIDPRVAGHWMAVSPAGRQVDLPIHVALQGIPRCSTFLPPAAGRPVRLAVGHQWGVSVFELADQGARLARLLTGHQGEVMAVAPSADGQLLVTAGRDQTIAIWSLADKEHHPEFGARFEIQNGRIVVAALAPDSPAWEAGFLAGDVVAGFDLNRGEVVYAEGQPGATAAQALDRLRAPEPGKQFTFTRVERNGQPLPDPLVTSVRQRPLLVFLPMRDRQWVLWRWRDYYYDTSTHGDFRIGWQVSGTPDRTPAFYRAEQFRNRFHRPDKLVETLRTLAWAPEPGQTNVFRDLEPPDVTVTLSAPEVRNEDLTVTVAVSPWGPHPNQQPRELQVWLNDDQLFATFPAPFPKTVTIPRSRLRAGANGVQVFCYCGADAATAQRTAAVTREVTLAGAPPPGRPDLHALIAAVDDYSRTTPPPGFGLPSFNETLKDNALALGKDLERQQGPVFERVHCRTLIDAQAQPRAVLDHLADLARPGRVRPDDVVLIYLGGHGEDEANPDKFKYLGPAFHHQRPETWLSGKDLYGALVRIPCAKIILLDTCHSGQNVDLVRTLTRDGQALVVLASCGARQQGLLIANRQDIPQAVFEIDNPGVPYTEFQALLGRGGSIFGQALLEALEDRFARADANHDGRLTVAELEAYLKARLPEKLALARKLEVVKEFTQEPQSFVTPRQRPLPLAQGK